jgi:hypothetical protein
MQCTGTVQPYQTRLDYLFRSRYAKCDSIHYDNFDIIFELLIFTRVCGHSQVVSQFNGIYGDKTYLAHPLYKQCTMLPTLDLSYALYSTITAIVSTSAY